MRARLMSALVVAALLLGACSGSSKGGDEPAADIDADRTESVEGPWSFTDDFDVTHELDEAPDVIVAEVSMAGALWDLGIEVDATFGQRELPDGTTDPLGLADPDAMESLGDEYGKVNLERLRLLEPDIIVTGSFNEGEYWGIEADIIDDVAAAAPIVALYSGGRPLEETAGRVADLAESLGADMDGEQVTAAIEAFETATADLEAALADKPGLTFMFASGTVDQLYVAVPSGYADLSTYQSLGMDIVEPDTDEQYWETLSWEELDRYQADVLMGDSRGGTVEQMAEIIPDGAEEGVAAIEAGQVGRWEVVLAPGYANLARVMSDLTEVVANADPDVV